VLAVYLTSEMLIVFVAEVVLWITAVSEEKFYVVVMRIRLKMQELVVSVLVKDEQHQFDIAKKTELHSFLE
jgi:hypothetical protein